MTDNLDHWQKRLESHFAGLDGTRRKYDLPVFALEHGLDQTELARVTTLLHQRLRAGLRLNDHWLVWVIYAAEQGYDYDGDEYWRTFESRTPYWTLRADRRSLRAWFSKFHKDYNGLKPTGPWAEWFSIIAWPITHALLPKDLQYQLARALYALRYQIAGRIHDQPAEIGQYVARASYDASSRFRNFLEQEEIAGRIILALLSERPDEVQHSIHPPTLARIVGDLERARNAREWLHDARRVVERHQLKGSSRQPGTGPSLDAQKANRTARPTHLAIRPTLVLRRTGLDEWTATLELPSLAPVADLVPELNQFLRQTRCSIDGSTGLLPAGWLLAGQQRRVLSSWPHTDRPVVRFECANAALDHFLQSDVRITSGPLWVFRVASDGLAHEIAGRLVRPGKDYILVCRTPPPALSLSRPTSINCSGVSAQHLSLPDQLTADQITELRSAGLAVAQTVRIWPAGLEARNWDGEGFTEWLDGESPCFGLDHDHPISGFELQLNGGSKLEVPKVTLGETVYVKLPPLPIGKHSLVVRAKSVAGASDYAEQVPIEGYVSLIVRSPQPWISGTTAHAGLVVSLEPGEPSLDEFWEGETQLQVLGPVGHAINISVDLMDGAGAKLVTEHVATLSLPMKNENWARAFTAFSRRESDPWGYLAASSGSLVIESDELGSYRFPLRRETTPLRWVSRNNRRGTVLRLIDDYEGAEPLSVRFHSFARPAIEVPIEPALIIKTDYTPTAPGGLFVASYPNQRQSLVVSMPQVQGGLAGLLIDPVLDNLPSDERAVNPLLRLLERWINARFVGPLASARRDNVVEKLKQRILGILCGREWAIAEIEYLRSQRTAGDLYRLCKHVGKPGFEFILKRDAVLFREMSPSARLTEFSSLAARYGLAKGVCAAALEFSEGIERGLCWDGATVSRDVITEMRRNPAVVRGARLLVLANPGRRVLLETSYGGHES